MTPKYKIYVPDEMKSRLMNDAELFEFTKKDGSINLNAFLKELLVNYFDQYREKKAELLDTIMYDLSGLRSISKKDAIIVADRIVNTYMKNTDLKETRNSTITLTVSGRSEDIMQTIEYNMLAEVSLSQYLNDLFSSYLSIPRNHREMIIFQDVFEELNRNIKNSNIITYSSTTAPGQVFSVRPYMIAASKEEQCNYLLCADNETGSARSFRISRIRALYSTGEKFKPDKNTKRKLQEIAAKNPQSASKTVEAVVYLTDRGVQKFRVILKNRPEAFKKEGNIYYFNWSKFELEEYFKRFGKDAVIVSPEDCHKSMKIFYAKALEEYSKDV